MRPVTTILIAVSLLAAGGATFVGKRLIEKRAADAVERQAELARDVEVLVAARDVAQGRMLKNEDLRWDRWPLATVEATGVVRRNGTKAPLDHLSGQALRRNIVAGEPITEAAVFTPGKGGLMPGLISPGMKAVGIVVNAASTASGFVLPGDVVDVILTVDIAKAGGQLPGGGRIVAETILGGVRVLAVDQEFGGEGASKSTTKKSRKKQEEAPPGEEPKDVAMVGKTVAIEVTDEQAQRVLAAQTAGKLSLALRSLADGTEDMPRGVAFVADVDASRAIRAGLGGGVRVIKGGQVSQ